jgi:phospholipid/cholesterol/gamma-HCH transport system permease protein
LDLTQVARVDTLVALTLIDAWGGDVPSAVAINPQLRAAFDAARLALAPAPLQPRAAVEARRASPSPGHASPVYALMLVKHCAGILVHPRRFRWGELARAIAVTGYDGLWITAIVGVLIGIVISYIGVQQLAQYGAETLIVQVIGMGILRELGPVLAAIMIAGRSGSALAAELAGMRISQELDALESLGINLYDRLVIPRVVGLTVSTPLLTAVADVAGLLGGTFAIEQAVNLRMAEFLLQMPRQVQLIQLTIGIGKAFAFGATVSIVSCYWGLRSRPDTASLAEHTTSAVVASVVGVLLLDAAFAILLHNVG